MGTTVPLPMAPESDLGCQETEGTDSSAPGALLLPAFPLSCSPALVSPALRLLGCISCDSTSCCAVCVAQSTSPWGHNIKDRKRTQQVIRVRRAIPHPGYNEKNYSNDIMLLKVNLLASPALLETDHFPSHCHASLSSLPSGCLTSPCGSGEREDTAASLPCPGPGTTG